MFFIFNFFLDSYPRPLLFLFILKVESVNQHETKWKMENWKFKNFFLTKSSMSKRIKATQTKKQSPNEGVETEPTQFGFLFRKPVFHSFSLSGSKTTEEIKDGSIIRWVRSRRVVVIYIYLFVLIEHRTISNNIT